MRPIQLFRGRAERRHLKGVHGIPPRPYRASTARTSRRREAPTTQSLGHAGQQKVEPSRRRSGPRQRRGTSHPHLRCKRCVGLAICLIAALADENGGSAGDVDTHWCGRARCGVWRGGLGCHWIVATSSAPRGAVDSDGGERPSSPCRRSGGVKLEAAVPGDRWGWWEQPRQSWVGPGLPDGSGPVSETGRYTRGTGVVKPLQATPALIRWMWAGSRCRPA